MKKSHVETIKAWINDRQGIKREAAAEPTPTTPALNSRQRNYLKWKSKSI